MQLSGKMFQNVTKSTENSTKIRLKFFITVQHNLQRKGKEKENLGPNNGTQISFKHFHSDYEEYWLSRMDFKQRSSNISWIDQNRDH